MAHSYACENCDCTGKVGHLWWRRDCPVCGGTGADRRSKRPLPPPAPPSVPLDNMFGPIPMPPTPAMAAAAARSAYMANTDHDRLRDLERRVTQLEAIEQGRRTAGQVMT